MNENRCAGIFMFHHLSAILLRKKEHSLAAVATGWAILGGGFNFISSLRLLFFSKSFSWIWSFEGAVVKAFRTAGAATEGRVVVLVWMIFATVIVCLVVVTGVVFVITIVVPNVGSWFIWFSTKVVVDGGCYQQRTKEILDDHEKTNSASLSNRAQETSVLWELFVRAALWYSSLSKVPLSTALCW